MPRPRQDAGPRGEGLGRRSNKQRKSVPIQRAQKANPINLGLFLSMGCGEFEANKPKLTIGNDINELR